MSRADIHFLVPGDPQTPTGGYAYDRRAIAGLECAGRLAGTIRIDGPFPAGDANALVATERALAAVPDGDTLVVDGLAYTALTPAIANHSNRLRVAALVHHPLGDETGLSPADRDRWLGREATALSLSDRVLVTSETTARRLQHLGVARARISVVPPGVDAALELEFRRSQRADPPRLLCVATLIPRKGQDILVKALEELTDRAWHLDLVGEARDPAYAARLRDEIGRRSLGHRVRLHGGVTEETLERLWRQATVFVFPSWYEGWGIAPVEAVRWGLPVIASDGGALPESIPSGARELVPAGDPAALASALAALLDDPDQLAARTEAAIAAAATLRLWDTMQREFVAAVSEER